MKRYTRKRFVRKNKKSHGITKSSSSLLPSLKELGLVGSLVGVSSITQGSELEDKNHQTLENNMFGGGNKYGCVNDIAEYILCFLELLNTIKIYHWSTLSYPSHKATDKLHTKLSELVDTFIEIYIGHCSRGRGKKTDGVPVFRFKSEKETCIEFCECKTLDTFCKVLDDNIVHLEGLTNKLKDYTDLVNIRDEMVGSLAHALYLLRLK
jgi:hypothetical protein